MMEESGPEVIENGNYRSVVTEEKRAEMSTETSPINEPATESSPTDDATVATLIPKYDVSTKQTSVYSHSAMTRRFSETEIKGSTRTPAQASTLNKILHYKDRIDQRMSKRGCHLSHVLVLLLALLTILFGSVFFRACSIQPLIPIFLIVAGVFVSLEVLFRIVRNVWDQSKYCESCSSCDNKCTSILRILNLAFLLIWFILGSVWVYGIYYPASDHCHHVLYNYAFGLLTLSYFLGLFCLLCGIALFIYANKIVLK